VPRGARASTASPHPALAQAASAWLNRAVSLSRTPGEEWSGRRLLRLVVLAVAVVITTRLVAHPANGSALDLVNLAFHEAGHVFLRPFGHILHVLGGTLFQLGVPALLVVYFLTRRRDPFAAAICLWWLGESLINVATYMADARDLALPLVGGGEHDWNELFFRFGLLAEPRVAAVSSTTRGLGIVTMLAGLAWGLVFVLPARLRSRLVLRLATGAPWALRLFSE